MKILTNLKQLSKTILAVSVLSISISACSKDDDRTIPDLSGLGVVHASPTAEKLDFYVENSKANEFDFSFGDKIDYLSLFSGNRKLTITKKGSSTPLLSQNFTLDPQKGYTLFVYDKFDVLKYLLVKDSLTTPAAGKAKVRFVHLSPDAPAVNLGIEGKTTDLFTDKSFKGYTDFVDIEPGAKVTFNVKNKTDGETVAATEVKIDAGRIYTVWLKGLAEASDATKLAVAVFEHK